MSNAGRPRLSCPERQKPRLPRRERRTYKRAEISSPSRESMSSDFAAARLNMVESQIRTADVTDLPLQDALRVVPREACVPAGKGYLAYADADVEYAPGRWLLRPREVGKLLQY